MSALVTSAKDLVFPTELVTTLDAHQAPVHVVRYNHGAKYCLSGSSDRTIRLWNPSLGKEIKCYKGHAHEILGLDISHDNAKFASCGGDKLVFVWDVATATVTRRLQGHFGKINTVAFNKDAQVLASGGFDAKVMLWDMRAAARDPIQTLKEATSSIRTILIPPKSPHIEILTAGTDGQIRTYDLRMGQVTEDLVGSPIVSLALSPSAPKDTLLCSTLDGKVRVFDRGNGGVLQTFQGHKVGEEGRGGGVVCWGYGEGLVVGGDEEGKIWSWGVLDGKPLDSHPKPSHNKAITLMEMTANGKEMITSSTDGTIKVWKTASAPS